jgi:hypothetical protein
VDALDETLDLFRSDYEYGRRNRLVVGVGTASACAAWIAHHATLGDVQTAAWNGADTPDWVGGSSLLPLLAPFVVYFAVRKRASLFRFAIAALVVPLLSLGVGLQNADNRDSQLDARAVFARYTQRFPSGRLHDVEVFDQNGKYSTVCASEGRDDPNKAPDDKRFCLEINLRLPGREVAGGYRYFADSGADPGAPEDVFDCFGDAIACIGAK